MTNRRLIFWVSFAVLLIVFIVLIRSILLPFVLGILTAYFLDPATDRMEKLGLSRGLATTAITAIFFVGFGLLSLLIIPLIVEQLSGLITSMPEYIANFEKQYTPQFQSWLGGLPTEMMESVRDLVSNLSGIMTRMLTDFVAGIFQSGMALINLLSLILITPVVTFYLLRDWDGLVERFHELLPRDREKTIREQLAIIDDTLAGFIHGQLNVCLILAVYYALGLTLVGLPFGLVIGIMTGLFAIVPYVGFGVGFITGMGVAFFQFGFDTGFFVVLGVFLVGQVMEGYFLTPKLVGEKVGLHPVWIIFGMLAGAALFGFVGVLLAIPATAVIGVLIRFATARYLESDYYHGERKAAKAKK